MEFSSILVIGGIFVAFVVIIILAIRYEKNLRVQVADQYQVLAETFRLEFTPGRKGSFLSYTYPRLAGQIDQTDIIIYSYKTGGKNKVTYTVLEMRPDQNLPDFRIIRDGLFQKIAKRFGGQDIVMGNPELDKKFRFTSEDEALFIEAMDSDMQQLLIHLYPKLLAPIEMKNDVVNYTFVNHIHTDERRDNFEKVLVLIVKIIKAMRT